MIVTAVSALAGLSFGIGEAEVGRGERVLRVFAACVTVLSVPAGASLTEVTSTVIVLADASRSTPPLAVPPSSCTWNVKLA